jgi:outer membrane protein
MLNKRLAVLALGLGLLAAAAGAWAQGGPGRVAFVATERLYTDSKMAKAADVRIAAEFSGRDKANQEMLVRLKKLSDKFELDAPALADAERTRRVREVLDLDKEVQRKQLAFRDDLVHRRNEERAAIADRAAILIGQVAQQEKIDVVLIRDVLWTRPANDITEKIIRQLDK